MHILENFSLKKNNTFGVEAKARFFINIDSKDALLDFYTSYKNDFPILILGGGSNILLTDDFDGYVLKINIKGRKIISENNDHLEINVNAGENWDDFVAYCVNNAYYGIENLSLIPGQVGTSPIQNIGAYGVEVKDTISTVSALNISTLVIESFDNAACAFSYRNSVFKHELKQTHIITDVTFKLSKNKFFCLDYGAIKDELSNLGVINPCISDVRNAICNIRNHKLPDPEILGNAGSFFKNPIVNNKKFEVLKSNFPDIVAYPQNKNAYKIAAGWLIEKCGWKGKRIGNAGVHDKQALVLINYGNASGKEVVNLAQLICSSVQNSFGITLEYEVNII